MFHRTSTSSFSLIVGCLTALLTATAPLLTMATPPLTLVIPDGATVSTDFTINDPNINTIEVTASGNTGTYSGVLSGDGSLYKTGAGTLIFSGGNTYTGITVVNEGVLEVAPTGIIVSAPGGGLSLGATSGLTGALVINGGNVSTVNSNVGYADGSTGLLTLNSGAWLNSNVTVGSGAGSTGVVNLNGGTATSTLNTLLGQGVGAHGTVNVNAVNWVVFGALVGVNGTGVINVNQGGTVTNSSTMQLGMNTGSSGTVNVNGGSLSSDLFIIGGAGTGVANLSSGSIAVAFNTLLGNTSTGEGTMTMSGGTFTTNGLLVGATNMGTFNLSGGNANAGSTVEVGSSLAAQGTLNVSGGTLTSANFNVGDTGSGVMNLSRGGVVTVGAAGTGTLTLAKTGGSGTLNIGGEAGGTAGTLNAAEVSGGSGTATVNFNQSDATTFNASLTGSVNLNQNGTGTPTLTAASTYTGTTTINSGTLELAFSAGTANNILPGWVDLTMGNGTLKLSNSDTGSATQFSSSLTVQDYSAANIVLGANTAAWVNGAVTLGVQSSLHFDVSAGGQDLQAVGSSYAFSLLQASGQLGPMVTITDATGFGLAELFETRVVRVSDAELLPSTGASDTNDYLIDNNDGGPLAAGSSTLTTESTESAQSITVDTTARVGTLTIGAGLALHNDIWNFGGVGSNAYSIVGGDANSSLSASAGGTLRISNYNSAPVTIRALIADNAGNDLQLFGTGTTIFTNRIESGNGVVINGGTMALDEGGQIKNTTGLLTVGFGPGSEAVLDMRNGSVNVHDVHVGQLAGSHGSVLIQRGDAFRDVELGGALVVGESGNGVVDIQGGHVLSYNGQIANQLGSTGTVTVENDGVWQMSRDLEIGTAGGLGSSGSGTLNLLSGFVSLNEGGGQVTLGSNSTVNFGVGGSTGFLGAGSITGTDSSSVVNFNYSYDSANGVLPVYTVLAGGLTVNKSGSGVLFLINQSTYTGTTTVNGGVLSVDFGSVTSDMLSSSSALVLGGGTFALTGEGTQTLNGLTTTASTGSAISVDGATNLNLGALTMGEHSALNFNTAAAGADGASPGSSSIVISGTTAGAMISNSFTVQDSTGFGLATVNALGQVIRLTDTALLPVNGASASGDYLIDGNDTYNSVGSANMLLTNNESTRSITVDTTQRSGSMTLDFGIVLSTDVWNFGGNVVGNDYFIIGFGNTCGLAATTAGGVMEINNYSSGKVYISTGILDNGGSGLLITGTNVTTLAGVDTYKGATTVNSGVLLIDGDHSAATGTTTVQTGGTLGGIGTMGGDIIVQQGGTLTPGPYLITGYQGGTLTGTTATFQSGSVFSLHGSGADLATLHLTGAVTIAQGAYLGINLDSELTQASYTLMTAASGLDGTHPFTLMESTTVPEGYKLVYTGTALQLNIIAPAVAYWTGAVSQNWSDLSAGSSNWATTVDGTTDTHSLPAELTDVYFSASNAGSTATILDMDYTINSLGIISDTSISRTDDPHTLTVKGATTVSALLAVNFGVTLSGGGDLTVDSAGTLAGDGTVQMAADQSMYIYGVIHPGNLDTPGEGDPLTLTTSGTGSVVMGASSVILFDLFYGAGDGNNTGPGQSGSSNQLSLHGTLDATAGGTLVIGNPNNLTAFAGGDQWQLVKLNNGNDPGSIIGQLAVDDSSLALAAGLSGTFDQSTGIYSIVDYRGELSALYSGLPMANAEMQGVIAAAQTATTDVNGHLFNLRNGSGEEEDEGDGSISASLDYGVVEGQGDGPESPMARRVRASRQWQVFATVNYGNVRLNPINSQAGVQVDSWASSVGIERHLSRGLTLGFAATFLQSTQNYTSGLGSMHLEGPTLSTYLAYARRGVWASLMYSFGDYDLGSFRNPGFGMPVANGATTAYVNSVQFNTGYNFRFQNNTFVTGPFVGIDYLHGSVDAYTETGGGAGALAFGRQSFESLVARVGWSASKRFHTNWAEITPQVRVSYERQNIHNNGTSVQSLTIPFSAAGGNQNPGQDYMVLGGGVNFQLTPALSLMLNYQTQIFRDNMTSHFGSIRLGYKF